MIGKAYEDMTPAEKRADGCAQVKAYKGGGYRKVADGIAFKNKTCERMV